MRKLRVYISGAIEGAPENGTIWRAEAKSIAKELSAIEILCPQTFNAHLETDNPGWRDRKSTTDKIYLKSIRRVITRDINLLRSSDICMVYWDKHAEKSVGTHGEMTDQFISGRKIYTVHNGINPDKLPAWVIGTTTKFFSSVEECLQAIQEEGSQLPPPTKSKINIAAKRQ